MKYWHTFAWSMLVGSFWVFVAFAQEPLSDQWADPLPVPDGGGRAYGDVGNNMAVFADGELVLIFNEVPLEGGGLKLKITRSTDDGKHWSTPQNFSVAEGLTGACCPTLAVPDPQQSVVHLIFRARLPEDGLYHTTSTDRGQTWSTPQHLVTPDRYEIEYQYITVDGKGRIHLFWHEGSSTNPDQHGEVWYMRSTDGGVHWSQPQRLSADDGHFSVYPRADYNGATTDTLLVPWRDSRASGEDWDIYGAITYDGGMSWKEVLLAGGNGKQWDPMAVVDEHGIVHLGVMEYPRTHPLDVFVWYTRSLDGGETWETPKTMREARTIFPVFLYDAAHDVIWYFLRIESDPGPDATSDLGVRYSLDQGKTWSEVERLTQLDVGGTKFPAFGIGADGIPRVAYTLRDTATGDEDLFFQKRKKMPESQGGGGDSSEVETFFAVHCEPQTPHLFPKLIQLVAMAERYGIPLTIQFAPQWVEAIMRDEKKVQRVRQWQQWGHEIAAHHHSVFHLNWDGFTNYADSVIHRLGKQDQYRGDMAAYWNIVEPIGGDSLLLTYGGPGAMDPDSSVDWYLKFWYRTGGGRDLQRAFSAPRNVPMRRYLPCQVDYTFLQTMEDVTTLETLYQNTTGKVVVGVTTHVFNFAADTTYVEEWMRFIQKTHKKTVRQIMRDHQCRPDSITTTGVEETLADFGDGVSLRVSPNPCAASTVIAYTVPAAVIGQAAVQVTILDHTGAVVRTLIDQQQTPGRYVVRWDGTDDRGLVVASSTYFCRVQIGAFFRVAAIVLRR